MQVAQDGTYVVTVRWTGRGSQRYETGIRAAAGWSVVAVRWERYGLGPSREASIQVEVRNAESLGGAGVVQTYVVKDILDTVSNVATGVDLFGH